MAPLLSRLNLDAIFAAGNTNIFGITMWIKPVMFAEWRLSPISIFSI
jgi:hypothetical protein